MWTLWKNNNFTDGGDRVQFNIMFYLLLLLTACAIATNVLLIYFLIAAIIESYNKVSQNLKSQKYLARAKILFENTLLFRRNEAFAGTRYVIKAQAERIDGDGAKSDFDGLTTAITASVKTSVEQESAKSDTNFKFLKNKIAKLQSAQENIQQLAEQQQ